MARIVSLFCLDKMLQKVMFHKGILLKTTYKIKNIQKKLQFSIDNSTHLLYNTYNSNKWVHNMNIKRCMQVTKNILNVYIYKEDI